MADKISANVLLPSREMEPNSFEASRSLALGLGLKIGDHVTVQGKRTAVAAVTEIVNGDECFIRPDTYTRQSVGATLHNTVEISRILKINECLRAILAPDKENDKLDEDEVKSTLLGRIIVQGQLVACRLIGSADPQEASSSLNLVLTVVETKPSSIVKVTRNTQVILTKENEVAPIAGFGYERIGGLDDTLDKLRIYVAASLSNSDLFSRLRIPKYRGILLRGPSGSGKTLSVNALLQETGAYRVIVSSDRLLRDGLAQACVRLKEKFAEAKQHSPAIIAFEKLDRICGKPEGYASPELEQLTTTLANELDDLGNSDVIVVASANSREALDPILLTAGRLDKEISFDPPNEDGRHEILKILTGSLAFEADVDLQQIAERTHGFTGADLEGLCTDAVYESITRQSGSLRPTGELSERMREALVISAKDFAEALKTRKPSCGRAYIRETAKVGWHEVAGLDELKAEIETQVILPFRYRHLASQLGIKPPPGILLYGPPGTGKTHLAKAISTRLGWPIISKRGAELTSKYLGETQKNIDDLFHAALTNAPATIHLDEIDSLAPRRGGGTDSASRERSSAVNTLLESIDRIVDAHAQILLVFTTNRIDMLDEAFLRSGRVEAQYYVGPPDSEGREAVFRLYAANVQAKEINYKRLAETSQGFTPADIKRVWEETSRVAFARYVLNNESDPDSTEVRGNLERRGQKLREERETIMVTTQGLLAAIEKMRSQNQRDR